MNELAWTMEINRASSWQNVSVRLGALKMFRANVCSPSLDLSPSAWVFLCVLVPVLEPFEPLLKLQYCNLLSWIQLSQFVFYPFFALRFFFLSSFILFALILHLFVSYKLCGIQSNNRECVQCIVAARARQSARHTHQSEMANGGKRRPSETPNA